MTINCYMKSTLKTGIPGAVLLLCIAVFTGCATHPVNYQGLSSTSELTPNPRDKSGHVPFLYTATDNDWSKYTSVILDPVTIYRGPDQQFGKTSETNKALLAGYMQIRFAKVLETKYALSDSANTNTLRIHLTLTGVETSTPVLSIVPKVVPFGIVFKSLESVFDIPDYFTGSVSFSAEVYDSMSNRLLCAYVTKQYPRAENVFASVRTLDASKAGIRNGAKGLLKKIH